MDANACFFVLAFVRKSLKPLLLVSLLQGSMEGNPVVQVALIAESSRLQMMLSTYGISTQTPHELEPVQIWPSWRMVKVEIKFCEAYCPSKDSFALYLCFCICIYCMLWMVE